MAWRHPQRIFEDAQVINDRDLLEALLPVIEELQGQVNEHNVSETIQAELEATDLALDIPMRWGQAGESAPQAPVTLEEYSASPPQPGVKRKPFTVQWRSLGYAKQITLEERCSVRVVAGCCFWFENAEDFYTGGIFTNKVQLLWAIRINGNIYADSIWGSQDYSEESSLGEKGYAGPGGAPKVETILDLPPGIHNIELVCKATEPPTESSTSGRSRYFNLGTVDIVVITLER